MHYRGKLLRSLTKKKYSDGSMYNYDEIKESEKCGCFYCKKIFRPEKVKYWTDSGRTAICPYCGVDSVLGFKKHERVSFTRLQSIHMSRFGDLSRYQKDDSE